MHKYLRSYVCFYFSHCAKIFVALRHSHSDSRPLTELAVFEMTLASAITLSELVNSGIPGPEHFRVVQEEVFEPNGEGTIQVQLRSVAADPFLRSRMKASGAWPSFGAGGTVSGFCVGKVVASNGNPDWVVGDLFGAMLPFKSVQNITPDELAKTTIWKLTEFVSESELDLGLSILGMPGSTAYGGVVDVLRPNEGETIWISAAAGSVGSMAGLLAKHLYNCKTIGSCGGPEKCNIIQEKFGYDHAIDYKAGGSKEELKAALKAVAPKGIDMYFENVGGAHFEAAFESMRPGGRIAVCGGISMYNDEKPTPLPFNPMAMVYPCMRIEGFLAAPYLSGKKGTFLTTMHGLLREGKLVPQDTVFEGMDKFGDAMRAIFTSQNVGKVVVHV
jgi:NADPH-dependent curcumin reductase CurA